MPTGPDPYRYPDVAAAGDLRTLLQATFDTAGVPLRPVRDATPDLTRISAGDRSASLVMAEHERRFLAQFWLRDVQMAQGGTTDLAATAGAIHLFLSGAPVRRLASAWPFVTFTGFAEAYERGDQAAIDHRWQEYLDLSSTRSPQLLDLHAFLLAAAPERRLRALFPFTSHFDLGFRRTVSGSPPVAWVRPHGEGRYLVTGPDRSRLGRPGPIRVPDLGPVPGALGPADPQLSVALLLHSLPPSP